MITNHKHKIKINEFLYKNSHILLLVCLILLSCGKKNKSENLLFVPMQLILIEDNHVGEWQWISGTQKQFLKEHCLEVSGYSNFDPLSNDIDYRIILEKEGLISVVLNDSLICSAIVTKKNIIGNNFCSYELNGDPKNTISFNSLGPFQIGDEIQLNPICFVFNKEIIPGVLNYNSDISFFKKIM